jgi:allophanate hydrolase subunit 2
VLDDSTVFTGAPTLTLLPGPRADWFLPEALDLLLTTDWIVTPQADRVGIRLAGPPLTRRVAGELPPEPMVAGALQVPPDGRPILFLADHPVTGGYPVIGVLTDAHLPEAAQLRPGATFRFAAPPR